MRPILFIAGLPKSGSTILELLLGAETSCIGLGEIYQLLKPDSIYLKSADHPLCACACGQLMTQCHFWGPLLPILTSINDNDVTQKYAAVVDRFESIFPNSILIDSSKTPVAINYLKNIQNLKVKALWAVRDVRGWSCAMLSTEEQQRRNELTKQGLVPGAFGDQRLQMPTSHWEAFRTWQKGNLDIQRTLKNLCPDFLLVSYEQLCMGTMITGEIAKLIGDSEPNLEAIGNSRTHNILGNRLRFDEEKRKRLIYDNRWLKDESWFLPWALMASVRKLNNSLVYENICPNHNGMI